MKSVHLLSGGIDSEVSALELKANGIEVIPIYIRMDQNAVAAEERCARAFAKSYLACDINILELNMGGFWRRSFDKGSEIPARNAIMFLMAAGIAKANGCDYVSSGIHSCESPLYKDCSAEFLCALSKLFDSIGFSGGILTPLWWYSKVNIVSVARNYGLSSEYHWYCDMNAELPCGTCASCLEMERASEACDSRR